MFPLSELVFGFVDLVAEKPIYRRGQDVGRVFCFALTICEFANVSFASQEKTKGFVLWKNWWWL